MAKWGVWGGRFPGDWCPIEVGGKLTNAGTKEEAVKQRGILQKNHKDFSYTVMPFNPWREPRSIEGIPTKPQWELLNVVLRTGCFNSLNPSRATIRAVTIRGWIQFSVSPEEFPRRLKLTCAGKRAFDRGPR